MEDLERRRMRLDENRLELLHRLNANWPSYLKFTLAEGRIADLERHPLREELAAIEAKRAASLPFFSPKAGDVRWFTAGKCAEELMVAIDQLRCWILPSFGWEEPIQPLVIPACASGQMGKLIVAIYPGGYFRWRTSNKSDCIQRVVNKLRAMRTLDALKPEHVFDRTPSLFELRQQYAIALATGDRDSAMEAVQTIDHHQVDTAVNTTFMQIRLWDQFREHSEIVDSPVVRELVRLRIPRSIRLSILKAYHTVFLAQYEAAGDTESAIRFYQEKLHPILSGLIRSLSLEDGLQTRRCLAYLACSEKDGNLAHQVLKAQHDPFLMVLFRGKHLQDTARDSSGTIEAFNRARQRGDWEDLQKEGLNLLRPKPEDVLPDVWRAFLPILLESLNHLPNPDLQRALAEHSSASRELSAAIPQTWAEFLDATAHRRWEQSRGFLNADTRPSLAELELVDSLRTLNTLEELLTDPGLVNEPGGSEVAGDMLAAFVEDFVRQELFPEDRYADVYRGLFHIWAAQKTGSLKTHDGHLLLVLAHAELSCRGDENGEIAGAIHRWWQARRVRALAPFVIEALELLVNYTRDMSLCENLWIELADLVRLDPGAYSPGEKSLLRQIGKSLDLDEKTIEEFLAAKPAQDVAEEVDILAGVGLKKVAIVSLHERAASLAAKMINERTKAPVILVAEKDAGAQTKSAKTADVILFVWSASKHAVYRAFDDVRDKLTYVQGVGASSIVLALERWATKNFATR
jgi:hypothetical protein